MLGNPPPRFESSCTHEPGFPDVCVWSDENRKTLIRNIKAVELSAETHVAAVPEQ